MAYDPYTRTYNATFGIGARVKVVRQRKYPSEKLIGLIGTVRTDSGTNVSVILDDVRNARSSYGAYYFKAIELVEVDENDNEVVEEENMNKVTNYLNTAKVRFVDDINACNSGLHSFANFEGDLGVGDLCVVVTEKGLFRMAAVVEISDCNDAETYREVVAKVNIDAYNSRKEWREKAAELKSKMEARAKQLQDIALYQMLAKDDSDMAALLHEYQRIPQV